MRSLALSLLLALTLPSAAQTLDPEAFDRILLPISFVGETPGAFGTRWTTNIVMHNDSDATIQYVGAVCNDTTRCLPAQTLDSRASATIQTPPGPLASQGAFVYVTRAAAADISFAANLQDLSRAEENARTELPVLRERDFHHRIVLPKVLLEGPFRTALRIYGFTEAPGTVRIRMYRLDGRPDAIVDEAVELNGIVNAVFNPFPSGPSFHHEFDVVARWPELAGREGVRIVLDADQDIWAFASQTNNATQLVTTVRPQ
jgi:hypothetical protein